MSLRPQKSSNTSPLLCFRNAFLHDKGGVALPKATKTGTTICGAVFDGGVVVGADTRATNGDIVAGNITYFQMSFAVLCSS